MMVQNVNLEFAIIANCSTLGTPDYSGLLLLGEENYCSIFQFQLLIFTKYVFTKEVS